MADAEREFIPGTVHLVDLERTLLLKHASGKKQDVILNPAPSADPEDPLNWSPRRKMLSTICMAIYTFVIAYTSAAIYSILQPLADARGLTLADLNAGTGYMFLAYGWGCLIFQPLAIQYGKRPVYVITMLISVGIMFWAPYTKSNGEYIANKVLQGFIGSPVESLGEVSVADIRGTYMAVYALALTGASFFAPIVAGFINDGQGWEWVMYWCGILCLAAFIFLYLFMEETNYQRLTVMTASEMVSPNSVDPVSDPTTAELPDNPKKPQVNDTTAVTSTDETIEVSATLSQQYRRKTFFDKLKFFQPGVWQQENKLLGMMARPLIFLTWPVIAFAGFTYGSILVWFNILNGTSSLILSGPPYHFKPSMMARRNKGVMEPEHRLWLLAISIVLTPTALIIWGVGAYRNIHWFGLVFAMGLLASQIAMGCSISITYCVDCYRRLSGETLITVILIRNTMSFAVSYGLTPWVLNMGYRNAFLVAAFAAMAQISTTFIFIKWGRAMRKRSIPKYLEYVEKTMGH
ncbi:hypothetical protein AYO20_09822 [Fonsecaea nubica]|uniref:Major facilitator superfamily (MFS) profile domain-containing protein n=1 Tax=Fonsecaea nubica TaxID=856822 RepID=A0A178CCY3_9EURO|nr:hypothetical protein AYO20_09822 [Fonsecaea nubica]OAL27224.1 hypothetical protein AYO20_09822 [Fonsecaea nubica]